MKRTLSPFQFSSSLIATRTPYLWWRRGHKLSILLESYCNRRWSDMAKKKVLDFQFSSSLIATGREIHSFAQQRKKGLPIFKPFWKLGFNPGPFVACPNRSMGTSTSANNPDWRSSQSEE